MTRRFCTICRCSKDESTFKLLPDSRGLARWVCASCHEKAVLSRSREGRAQVVAQAAQERKQKNQQWAQAQSNLRRANQERQRRTG